MAGKVATAIEERPRLEMLGVHKSFGTTIALGGVDFNVRRGEVHALVGENGAGKSTLMKILSGAEKADAGEMRLDGIPFSPADTLEARLSGVAMIYQELSLVDHLSVEENISLGMEPTTLGFVRKREANEKAIEALTRLGHPDIDPNTPVKLLPIAERQIVEIARAIAKGCRILVLDEPTSSLTRKDVKILFKLIALLKQQEHAIVYISHFIEEIKKVSDRFTVLRDGRTVGTGLTELTSIDDIAGMMIGRRIEQFYPRSIRSPGEIILTTKDLSGWEKLKSADFTLRRGEVLGIAGLVGAGRTELLRTLFSLDKVRQGEIRIAAYCGPASPAQRLAQGMGLQSEDRKGEGLALSLSLADNLTMSRMKGMGPVGLVLPSRRNAAAQRWIERLDIRCLSPEQRVSGLSGGNQQKVALARLLHHDVDILLLDEPTKGIDVASKAQIYRLIDELATGNQAEGKAPRAILMVSSYFPELLGVCDRIAVMYRGVMSSARKIEELDEHQLLLEATGKEPA
jgi:ribose transport system ATP-binding protein